MFFCNVCWIETNHSVTYNEHLKSKNHLSALSFKEELKSNLLKMPFYCELCSLYVNSEQMLQQHLLSDKHNVKLEFKQRKDENNNNVVPKIPISRSCFTFSTNTTSTIDSDKTVWDSKWCHTCFCLYGNQVDETSHLDGKDHKKKKLLKETSRLGDLFCPYCCQKPGQLDQLKIHNESKNHLDQVKRYDIYYNANKHLNNVTHIDPKTNFYSDKPGK